MQDISSSFSLPIPVITNKASSSTPTFDLGVTSTAILFPLSRPSTSYYLLNTLLPHLLNNDVPSPLSHSLSTMDQKLRDTCPYNSISHTLSPWTAKVTFDLDWMREMRVSTVSRRSSTTTTARNHSSSKEQEFRNTHAYSSISHTSSSWTVKNIFDLDWIREVRVSAVSRRSWTTATARSGMRGSYQEGIIAGVAGARK